MQANSWHKFTIYLINATFTCPFESGKCGKKEKRLWNLEYLKNKKSFLDEINFS